MIGRDLPPPRRDLRCYRHDIGVAWLWLAASRGAFGRVERIVSEREMRSRDGAAAAGSGSDRAMVVSGSAGEAALPADRAAAERGGLAPVDDRPSPFGVPLGGVGPRGQTRLHYPDLLLIGHTGERLAIELELSAKGVRRLETILAGYGADPRIASVLYLAEKPRIRRDVQAAAARLGISDLVHVQPIAWPALAALSKGRERAVARVEITPAADLHAGVPPRAHRHDPREALAR
jgi:hypothetical protein